MVRLRVKELLQERHISMGKLSRLSDLSLSTINRVCNDPTYSPTLNTLERIVRVLGVQVRDLFVEEQDE